MDKQPAEKDLLGTVVAERSHQPPGSGEPRAASGSLGDEGNAAQAVLSTTLQQLVSATVTTSSATSPISPTVPAASNISKPSTSTLTPEELASREVAATVTVERPLSTTPFNNRQQGIVVSGPYELCCEVLDNCQGVIAVEGPLTIHCGQLLGSAGVILATGPITLVCGEFINDEGRCVSYTSKVTVSGRYLLNKRGTLHAQQGVSVHVQEIDNRDGLVESEGALSLEAATVNNGAGQLHANTEVTLTSGSLRGQGLISSGGELQITLSSQQPHRQQGVLRANGSLRFTTAASWENLGQLQASEWLTVKTPEVVNRAASVIAGKEVTLGGLTPRSGAIINEGQVRGNYLHLQAEKISNCGAGRLTGDWVALDAIQVQNGAEAFSKEALPSQIAARVELSIGAQQLINRNGALLKSQGKLVVGAQLDSEKSPLGQMESLDNASATIEIQGDADFKVTTFTHRNAGFVTNMAQVSAVLRQEYLRDDWPIRGVHPNEVVQYNGQRVAFNCLHGPDYDNVDQGSIRSSADPTRLPGHTSYRFTRTVTETQVTSSAPAQLQVGGDISVSGCMTNDKSQIVIGGAWLAGLERLTTVESCDGIRVITDEGMARHFRPRVTPERLWNTQYPTGAPQPYYDRQQKPITLSAAVERHQAHAATSGEGDDQRPENSHDTAPLPPEEVPLTGPVTPFVLPVLPVTLARPIGVLSVNNRQQRLMAAGPYELCCEVMDNRQGVVVIDGPLTIRCGYWLGGQGIVAATGPIQLICQMFFNQQGQIVARQSALTITSYRVLHNQGGLLKSQGKMTLTCTAFEGAGTIQAGDDLQLNLQQEQTSPLQGALRARGETTIRFHGVLESGGQLESKKNLILTGPILKNRGRIAAAWVNIQATELINGPAEKNPATSEALIVGKRVTLRGPAGEAQSEEKAAAGHERQPCKTLDNAGTIHGDQVDFAVRQLNNHGSGEIAGGRVVIEGAQLTNAPGAGSDGTEPPRIVASQLLAIAAAQLQQRGGASLRSNGDLMLGRALDAQQQPVGALPLLNNQGAHISAVGTATLRTVSCQHDADSTLKAGEALVLESDTLGGAGSITSGGTLVVTLHSQQPVALHGPLRAGDTLRIMAPGALNNYTCWEAGNALTVTTPLLYNYAEGSIRSAGETTLVLTGGEAGQMDNRGTIDGATTMIRGHTLNNVWSGAIYGDQVLLDIKAQLNNDGEQPGNHSKPMIIARQSLKIGARVILNSESALLMSAGDMALGLQLDEQRQLTGQMESINNHSATIDIQGDANFNVATFENQDLHFSTREVLIDGPHRTVRHDPSPHAGNRIVFDYHTTTTETRVVNRAPAKLLIGGNLNFDGNCLNNCKSQVVIGGAMIGIVKDINNVDAYGRRVTAENGTTQRFHHEWHGHLWGGNEYWSDDPVPYHPAPRVKEFPLSVVTEQRNTRPAGSGVQIAARMSLTLSTEVLDSNQSVLAPWTLAPEIVEIKALDCHPETGAALLIRSSSSALTLPKSGLFSIQRQATGPLITTDPRFSNHFSWSTTTDALLRELRLSTTLPRQYGDGCYQQQRIRDQVIQLTGQRFLAGYRSDVQQSRVLIAQGIAAARRLQLLPGVALTAVQQAELTQAIVWPVVKSVTLENGQTIEVLDVQLYVPTLETAMSGSANALLSANNFNLQLSGALHNSGIVIGSKVLEVEATNIHNQGTLYGGSNRITARKDINNLSGNLIGEHQLQVQAAENFRSKTQATTTAVGEAVAGQTHYSRTTLGPVAGLYVQQPGGQLTIEAGGDAELTATQVGNFGRDGHTTIAAGGDLHFGTVTEGRHDNLVWDAGNHLIQGGTIEKGSKISAAGRVELRAGRQLEAKALQVRTDILLPGGKTTPLALKDDTQHSELRPAGDDQLSRLGANGGLLVSAGSGITIRPGQANCYYERATECTSHGFFSTTTNRTHHRQQQAVAIGSSLSGAQVTVTAGRDATLGDGQLTIEGSKIASDHNTVLQASGTVAVRSAENRQQRYTLQQEEKSGLFSGGGNLTLGKREEAQRQWRDAILHAGSGVGSLQGDVKVETQQCYQQVASQLLAPQGNIIITAKEIDIQSAANLEHITQERCIKQSGLSLGATNPIYSLAQTGQQLESAVSQTDDPRMQALAAAAGGLAAVNTVDALKSNPQHLGGVNFSLSLGSQQQESRCQQRQLKAMPSHLLAGESVTIVAEEALSVEGSQIAGGKQTILQGEQLRLQASYHQQSQQSENSSRSSAVGVGFGSDGLSVQASGSKGDGHAEGIEHTPVNTQIRAGKGVFLQSTQDTTLRGAVISAPRIAGVIDGNLTLESLQESSQYDSRQKTISGSASLGAHSGSLSLNLSQSKMHSALLTVKEQTAIQAGAQGFDLIVKKNTHLIGAKISSDQSAIDAKCNRLITGSLSARPLENHAEYQAQQIAIGGGISKSLGKGATEQQPLEDTASSSDSGVGRNQTGEVVSGSNQTGEVVSGSNQVPGSRLPNLKGLSAGIPIILSASGSARSTTRSGISGAAITLTNPEQQWARTGQTPEQAIASLNRQVTSEQESSNTLAPIFNQAEIEAGFAIVGTLVREEGTFLAHRCQEISQKRAQANDLIAQAEDIGQPRTPANRRALRQQADQLHQQAQAIALL